MTLVFSSPLRALLACSLVALGTVSCASPQHSQPEHVTHPLMPRVQYIAVPENRQDDNSRHIQVAFLHLKSNKSGVPTFVTFGGPGESLLDYASMDELTASYQHLLDIGDVVFIEQRGIGASVPHLDCAPVKLSPTLPTTRDSLLTAHKEVLSPCIRRSGADLKGYTTVEIADDMEAVRRALDFDKINLSGGSYGAQQAYFYLRRHGEHVGHAYLSQFLAPGTSLALPTVIDSYVEIVGERTGPRFGIDDGGGAVLLDMMDAVMVELEQTPVQVDIDGTTVVLGRTDLEIVTSLALRRTQETLLLPMIYKGMMDGQFDLIAQAALQFYRQEFPVNAAVLALDCASQDILSRQRLFKNQVVEAITGPGAHLPFPDVCNDIEHGRVGLDYDQAGPILDVPILFVQGELDPRARDENLNEVLALAPGADLIVIKNATHDLGTSVSKELVNILRVVEAEFLQTGRVRESATLENALDDL